MGSNSSKISNEEASQLQTKNMYAAIDSTDCKLTILRMRYSSRLSCEWESVGIHTDLHVGSE